MGYLIDPNGDKDHGEYQTGPDKPYIIRYTYLHKESISNGTITISAHDNYAARGEFKRAYPTRTILSVIEDTD